MCRGKNHPNPRRCPQNKEQRDRANRRRREGRAFRRSVADAVAAKTGDAELRATIMRTPISLMSRVAEEHGLDAAALAPEGYTPTDKPEQFGAGTTPPPPPPVEPPTPTGGGGDEEEDPEYRAAYERIMASLGDVEPPATWEGTPAQYRAQLAAKFVRAQADAERFERALAEEEMAAIDTDPGAISDVLDDLGDRSNFRDVMYDSPGAKQVRAAHAEWLSYRERAVDAREARADFDPVTDPEGRHAAETAAMDASLDEVLVREKYENLADEQARAVFAATDGVLPRYERDTLGNLTVHGTAEEGSAQWHEMRQDGFGASSILAAAGYEMSDRTGNLKRVAPGARAWQMKELLEEKTADIDPADHEGDITDGGAANRGHMWEEALLVEHAEATGMNIAIGKSTWKGPDEFAVVNLDGIELDDEGNAIGIIECKKIDNPEPWTHPVTGEVRPPLNYAAQSLYLGKESGFDKVTLLADVGGEKHVFEFRAGDPIDGTPGGKTIDDILPDAQKAWDAVKDAKAAKAAGRPLPRTTKPYRRPIDTHGFATVAAVNNVTGLLAGQMTKDEVKAELYDRRDKLGSMDSAVRSLLGEKFDRSKLVMVGVDGETAAAVDGDDGDPRAFSPSWSSWIETGIVVHDGSGKESSSLSKLHGVDPRIAKLNGTGAQHVHNISPEMVAGKRRFEDDHDDVREALLSGNVIVAHNAEFEQRHLHAKVKGLKDQRPWIDTKWLSAHFMPRGDANANNRLASFAPENGVPYDGAHRAEADTRMMMSALENFLSRDKWWESPTD